MKNLVKTFLLADSTDRAEGRVAYLRYHLLMKRIAKHYNFDLDRVVAAFVALSPNSDYQGNLRSLVSCLQGHKVLPPNRITVSTYNHCKERALDYLNGAKFLEDAKGLKTRNFYVNVLDPNDETAVTIDGHIYAVWSDQPKLTMKEAKVSPATYREILEDFMLLGKAMNMVPNQIQATLWFTRKRLQNIKYDPQTDLFFGAGDVWRTEVPVEDIRPYKTREIVG